MSAESDRDRLADLIAAIPPHQRAMALPAEPSLTIADVVAELADLQDPALVAVREHDLRGALDQPGARELEHLEAPLNALAQAFSTRITVAGLPSLRITAEQWGAVVGADPDFPRSCLVADRFELFRGLAGRRSERQMRTWSWSADPTAYLACLELRSTDLLERDPRVPLELQLSDVR